MKNTQLLWKLFIVGTAWRKFIQVFSSTVVFRVRCVTRGREVQHNLTYSLGAFAKLRKTTVSFVMCVCLPVLMEQTARLPLDGFWWNLIFELFFRKSVEKIKVSSKYHKNNVYFTWRRFHIYDKSRWILLRMRNVWSKSCSEIKIHILCLKTFFPKIVPFMR